MLINISLKKIKKKNFKVTLPSKLHLRSLQKKKIKTLVIISLKLNNKKNLEIALPSKLTQKSSHETYKRKNALNY